MHLRVGSALCVVLLFATLCPAAQDPQEIYWQPQASGLTVSLRGLDAVDGDVAWTGGPRGSYSRTVDGGKTWLADSVADGARFDFRDVHAVDARTAYLMSAGTGDASRILKTTDGGKTWATQYVCTDTSAFLDGIAFRDDLTGVAYGDPLQGRLFVLTTTDGGANWRQLEQDKSPRLAPGEYGFAASGTGIAISPGGHLWIGSGGKVARVFVSSDFGQTWVGTPVPLISGDASTGVFSVAVLDDDRAVIVGGDYAKPERNGTNYAMTTNGGFVWQAGKAGALPYRSCVAAVPGTDGRLLIAVGPTGADYSPDGGKTWRRFGEQGYHSVSFGSAPGAGWASGSDGRVAKLVINMGS